MFVRLLTPLLLAGAICSLVSNAHASSGNPKTRPILYQRSTDKYSPEELAAQKKAVVIAQQKSGAQQWSGGFQQGHPSGVPTTLALNGSDSCATPDPISGVGSFTFDNSLATNEQVALASSRGESRRTNMVGILRASGGG